MKIYILRHEKRFESPEFYTNLTPTGHNNSENLKYVIEKENIDLIFSSPFPRVLQTIKPYCDMKNIKVNVDYSLYETMYDDKCFTKENYKKNLSKINPEFYLSNPEYKSLITIDDIKCPEIREDVEERTTKIFNHIFNEYKNTEKNILIASHACAINTIINKSDASSMYPQGGLTKIFDEDPCYVPINFAHSDAHTQV